MAKADSIVHLAKAALERNNEMVVQSIRSMSMNEPDNSTLKQRLKQLLERSQRNRNEPDNKFDLPQNVKSLVNQSSTCRTLAEVTLSPESKDDVVSFLNDYRYRSELMAHGLAPRNRLLLTGEPGTGKTTLACAIANELSLPCFVVSFGGLIDSHFGGTGNRLQSLFQALSGSPCVIFLDELETLLCERSRANSGNEVGEVARVVTTLLQQIDLLPLDVLLFGATNHPDMLDKAVVRRFDMVIQMPEFTTSMVPILSDIWSARFPGLPVSELIANISLAEIRTPAELERVFLSLARKHVKTSHKQNCDAIACFA